MQLDLVYESWLSLKGFVNPIDRDEAAQALVSALIDNGADVDDIQSAFAGDTHVKTALGGWTDEEEEEFDQSDDYLDSDEID